MSSDHCAWNILRKALLTRRLEETRPRPSRSRVAPLAAALIFTQITVFTSRLPHTHWTPGRLSSLTGAGASERRRMGLAIPRVCESRRMGLANPRVSEEDGSSDSVTAVTPRTPELRSHLSLVITG